MGRGGDSAAARWRSGQRAGPSGGGEAEGAPLLRAPGPGRRLRGNHPTKGEGQAGRRGKGEGEGQPPGAGGGEIDYAQPVLAQVKGLGDRYWAWVHEPVDLEEPRFFGHPLLESFSKTPWWVVPLVWVPVAAAELAWALGRVWATGPADLLRLAVGWLVGYFLAWPLLEYLLHRHLFHLRVSGSWANVLHYVFHGCHHKFPKDKLRLVFPPLPAAIFILGFLKLFLAGTAAGTVAQYARHAMHSGAILSYVAYDCTHYFLHNKPLKGERLRRLKRLHMLHHYKDCDESFGITTQWVDWLLGTAAAAVQ